ncbi:hypothetical protein [Delftia sp. PS-11]|nr:hypothetical protein [Delftia sp. PS-11]
MLPALWLGAWFSKRVHQRIDGRWLRGFVQVFAMVSGTVLLLRAW